MLKKIISNILKEALAEYLSDLKVKDIDYYIEIGYAAEDRFGDYVCPIAMRIAKALKKNPFEIANSIIKKIDRKYFEKIEAAKPGFINLTLSYDYINECINDLLNNDNYGRNTAEDKKNIA